MRKRYILVGIFAALFLLYYRGRLTVLRGLFLGTAENLPQYGQEDGDTKDAEEERSTDNEEDGGDAQEEYSGDAQEDDGFDRPLPPIGTILIPGDDVSEVRQILAQSYGENEVIVYDGAGLKAALEDSQTEIIYLGADIEVPGGIRINPSKPRLVIDGKNPEQDGILHTLTDYSSTAQTSTIYLNKNEALTTIELKNLIMNGKNHYGPVTIFNEAKDITIVYENIMYQGPQLTFNKYGSAYYIDSTIEIGKFNGPSSPGELGEVGSAFFGGTVTVRQIDPQVNEIFFCELKEGSIEILENAVVEIITATESGFYYGSTKTNMIVHKNASFKYKGKRQFWENVALQEFTVSEGASVIIELEDRAVGRALLRVNGQLRVLKDGVLHLLNQGASSYPALVINQGGIELNDPKSVILYSPGARAIQIEGSSAAMAASAQQINYWTVAGKGGYSDLPNSRWEKFDGSNFTIQGTITTGSSGNFTAISSNYTEEDQYFGEAPSPSNFNLSNGRLLSFGRMGVTANIGNDSIFGQTDPFAEIYGALLREDQEEIIIAQGVFANGLGNYQLDYENMNIEDHIKVKATSGYLYAEADVWQDQKLLMFESVPDEMVFQKAQIPDKIQTVQRDSEQWGLRILDTRGVGSQWKLYARWQGFFTPENEDLPLYYGNMIFKTGEEEYVYMHPLVDVPIKTHTATADREIVPIDWAEDRGILILLEPGLLYADEQYYCEIEWILADVP